MVIAKSPRGHGKGGHGKAGPDQVRTRQASVGQLSSSTSASVASPVSTSR